MAVGEDVTGGNASSAATSIRTGVLSELVAETGKFLECKVVVAAVAVADDDDTADDDCGVSSSSSPND